MTMRDMFISALVTWSALTAGNFIWAAWFRGEWQAAVERSFFQLVAALVVALGVALRARGSL